MGCSIAEVAVVSSWLGLGRTHPFAVDLAPVAISSCIFFFHKMHVAEEGAYREWIFENQYCAATTVAQVVAWSREYTFTADSSVNRCWSNRSQARLLGGVDRHERGRCKVPQQPKHHTKSSRQFFAYEPPSGAGAVGGPAPGAVHSLCGAVLHRSRTGGPVNRRQLFHMQVQTPSSPGTTWHVLLLACAPTRATAVLNPRCPAGPCTTATTATRTSQTMCASSVQTARTLTFAWSASLLAWRPARTATPTATG